MLWVQAEAYSNMGLNCLQNIGSGNSVGRKMLQTDASSTGQNLGQVGHVATACGKLPHQCTLSWKLMGLVPPVLVLQGWCDFVQNT